jgi:hypothetical protein
MFPYRRALGMAQSIVNGNHWSSTHPRIFGVQARPETLRSLGVTDCYYQHKLTRLSLYRSDKLSRLAPPSELIDRPSSCEIRRLAEGERPAPVLRGQLAYFLSKSSLI